MAWKPPPGVQIVEQAYQGVKGRMNPRLNTSQLQRVGPNEFVDALGQRYDGKGRPMELGGSRPWLQSSYGQGGSADYSGGGGGGGAGGPSPFDGKNWQTFDPSKAPPIPGASQVGQTYLSAVDAYKRALAQFNQQRQGLMTQYGYTSDVDPVSGVMKNTRVDPNNPYGEYQLNRRSNYMDYLGAEENRMSRGLGRKGLGAQMLNDMRFGWGGKDSATSRALIDSMSGIDQAQQSAYANMTNSYWEALLSAAQSGIEGGDFGYPGEEGYYGDEDEGYYAGMRDGDWKSGKQTPAGKNYGLGVYRDSQGRLTYKAPRRVTTGAGAGARAGLGGPAPRPTPPGQKRMKVAQQVAAKARAKSQPKKTTKKKK